MSNYAAHDDTHEWRTAAEIIEDFRVNAAKLESFARRGNLVSKLDGGLRLYDLFGVERLFPRRGSPALMPRTSGSFGTLGGFQLGTAADEANRHVSHLPTRASQLPAPALRAAG